MRIETRFNPSLKDLQKRLDAARKEVGNLSTPMKKVSIFLDRWVQENFQTEGGKVGGWAPLEAGGRWIEGTGLDTSAMILQDIGRGRASFTPFATAKDAGIGSDLPYMRSHNEGEDGQKERRILPEMDDVEDDVKEMLTDHVITSFKKKGFDNV